MTDAQLLRTFADSRSQEAFTELVRRHIDWVYSAARRMTHDGELAEDLTQAVFILVARKAATLARHPHFHAWLFQATRFCAGNALKLNANRRRHEKEAGAMRTEAAPNDDPWGSLAPQLEAAMARLATNDREALLLRFYRGKKLAEVGTSLGIGEEAAKKRIQRALEKLRAMLAGAGEAEALGALLATRVTHAAPAGLMVQATALTGKSASAATLAKAAAKAMAWAQWKLAACIVAGAGIAGGVGYETITRSNRMHPSALTVPITAPRESNPAAPTPTLAAADFDPLYEKAPGSAPDLTMKAGPNTFAVTALLRYDADGKTLVTNGLGKPIDPKASPFAAIPAPAGAGLTRDLLRVQLSPHPDRFDIDRLRIFDHATRRLVHGVMVTQVPGTSILDVTAMPGTLPAQIDLWLAVASYHAATTAAELPASKGASVVVAGSTVGFVDLRDGQWNYAGAGFATVNGGSQGASTSLQLQASRPWTVGRYQVAAVTNDHRKYLSDFFVDFSFEAHPILFFPMGLAQIDHLELRPSSHQPPFYFDGVILPTIAAGPLAEGVSKPTVILAHTAPVPLPSGGTIELAGIGHYPSTDGAWWGVDGKPVPPPPDALSRSLVILDKQYRGRELFARLQGISRHRSDIFWQIDGNGGWAGGGNGKSSRICAALPHDGPVTVRIGVPATGWQTLDELPADRLPAEFKAWPGVVGALSQQAGQVRLTLKGMEMSDSSRLVLVDLGGKVHPNTGWEGSADDKLPPWGEGEARMTFRGLTLEDVESVRLEVRPMEYAEFRDVPMEPR